MGRRRQLLILLLVALGLGVAWRVARPVSPRGTVEAGGTERVPETDATRGSDRSLRRPPSPDARARRDALREGILTALEQQQQPPGNRVETARPAVSPTEPRAPYPEGHLNNRVGGRDALVGFLNRQFMPLAHECIDLAQVESPGMKGMLAINVETVADEKLGAVVEAADAAPSNEIPNPSLVECIRESALSLRLPPSAASGREKFMLTLRVEPAHDGGAH